MSEPKTPIDLITEICAEFEAGGIASIGANGAIQAMAPHWQEHLDQGHGPEIISADIQAMQERVTDMQATIVHRISAQAAQEGRALANLLPENLDQIVSSLKSTEDVSDQDIMDFWVSDCSIPMEAAKEAIQYREQFQKNPEFKMPVKKLADPNAPVLLRYSLVKTARRLTFDVLFQAKEVTYTGDDDGDYFKFVASNKYEVISRSRMDIQTERIWLLGASEKYNRRSGSMVFSTDQKRDIAFDRFVVALNEWADFNGGLAIRVPLWAKP